MSNIVTLPYDPEWRALSWAKANCPSYITNQMHPKTALLIGPYIDYYFSDDKDATFFALKWL